MSKRILKRPEVESITGLSRSRIYFLISQQKFPSQINLTPEGRSVGWLESDVLSWLDERIEASKA